ncbi:hypothetical protein [Okeania sp. SIO3I5]|nr:hypothetical protein [Okeania sp. SIO3I5]
MSNLNLFARPQQSKDWKIFPDAQLLKYKKIESKEKGNKRVISK